MSHYQWAHRLATWLYSPFVVRQGEGTRWVDLWDRAHPSNFRWSVFTTTQTWLNRKKVCNSIPLLESKPPASVGKILIIIANHLQGYQKELLWGLNRSDWMMTKLLATCNYIVCNEYMRCMLHVLCMLSTMLYWSIYNCMCLYLGISTCAIAHAC